jgi:predicted RNA-binding protein with PIN domain
VTFTEDTTWYFDGYNVLHAVLLGHERDVSWWHRDYQQRVVARVEEWMRSPELPTAAVTVVFDAHRLLSDSERVHSSSLNVVYAPNADDWLINTCELGGENNPCFVTADRSLSDKLKARGARIVKPWDIFPSSHQD